MLFQLLKKKLKNRPEVSLRLVPGLKIFVIALVWSGVAVLIPVLQNEFKIDKAVLFLLVQYFLVVVVLMIPFEIRDLKYDLKSLRTLPQILGINKTKVLGGVIVVVVFFVEILKEDRQLLSLAAFLIVLMGFVVFSRESQPKYYSSFWVEALPVLWLLLIMI